MKHLLNVPLIIFTAGKYLKQWVQFINIICCVKLDSMGLEISPREQSRGSGIENRCILFFPAIH